MKKMVSILLLVCVLLAGCQSAHGSIRAEAYPPQVAWVNYGDAKQINTKAENKGVLETSGHLPIYRIDSLAELKLFQLTFAGVWDFGDYGWDQYPGWETATAAYTDDFFREMGLLLVYVKDSSATPKYAVKEYKTYQEGKALCVFVERINDPQVLDCAMAGWMCLVPVPRATLDACQHLDAVFSGMEPAFP